MRLAASARVRLSVGIRRDSAPLTMPCLTAAATDCSAHAATAAPSVKVARIAFVSDPLKFVSNSASFIALAIIVNASCRGIVFIGHGGTAIAVECNGVEVLDFP